MPNFATDIATSQDLSTLPTSTTRRKGRSMTVRRVVTGHSPDGEAIFVNDTEVPPMPIGDRGSATTTLWYRDDPAQFPDDGTQPIRTAAWPSPGGCSLAVMELAPEG